MLNQDIQKNNFSIPRISEPKNACINLPLRRKRIGQPNHYEVSEICNNLSSMQLCLGGTTKHNSDHRNEINNADNSR